VSGFVGELRGEEALTVGRAALLGPPATSVTAWPASADIDFELLVCRVDGIHCDDVAGMLRELSTAGDIMSGGSSVSW
jgi:hypothetical protein